MEQSAIENAQIPSQPFNRFAIPVKWGVIWGILSCILMTVQHMFFMNNYLVYMILFVLLFIVACVMYCLGGIQQRKAMGGYISFKEAFQAIFIIILISYAISTIYTVVYFKWIDPEAIDRLKEQTLASLEKWDVPEEQIDATAAEFEKNKSSFGFGQTLLSFSKGLIFHSIFGFICAAIVKKKKPEFGA